jgi:YHS domain-containing protein
MFYFLTGQHLCSDVRLLPFKRSLAPVLWDNEFGARMFRFIGSLLVIVFLITLLRSVIGFVLRVFFNPNVNAQRTASRSAEPVPLTGELKRDPVCGTYTAAATSIQKTIAGQTYYFCSPQCRDKFAPVKT